MGPSAASALGSRYSNVRATVDSGRSVTRVQRDWEDASAYSRRKPDEPFSRISARVLGQCLDARSDPPPGPDADPRDRLPECLVLDVRSDPTAHALGRVEGSVPYPVQALLHPVRPFSALLLSFKNLAPHRVVVVACDDERESARAARLLHEKGFDNAYLLTGGMARLADVCPHHFTGHLPAAPLGGDEWGGGSSRPYPGGYPGRTGGGSRVGGSSRAGGSRAGGGRGGLAPRTLPREPTGKVGERPSSGGDVDVVRAEGGLLAGHLAPVGGWRRGGGDGDVTAPSPRRGPLALEPRRDARLDARPDGRPDAPGSDFAWEPGPAGHQTEKMTAYAPLGSRRDRWAMAGGPGAPRDGPAPLRPPLGGGPAPNPWDPAGRPSSSGTVGGGEGGGGWRPEAAAEELAARARARPRLEAEAGYHRAPPSPGGGHDHGVPDAALSGPGAPPSPAAVRRELAQRQGGGGRGGGSGYGGHPYSGGGYGPGGVPGSAAPGSRVGAGSRAGSRGGASRGGGGPGGSPRGYSTYGRPRESERAAGDPVPLLPPAERAARVREAESRMADSVLSQSTAALRTGAMRGTRAALLYKQQLEALKRAAGVRDGRRWQPTGDRTGGGGY